MNLKFGSQLIKILLILGIIVALVGVIAIIKLSASYQDIVENFLFQVVGGVVILETALFVITFWIYNKRKLLSRVNRLAYALERGADGDLTIRVPATENDEIGQLGRNLNSMLEKLSEFVERVNSSLRELRNISQNTTNAAGQLVNAAETQSVAAKETSGAVEKISNSIELLSKEIDKVAQSASHNSGAIRMMSTSLDLVGQNIDMQSMAIDEVSSSIFQVAAEVKQIASNVNSLMAASTETTSAAAAMDVSIKEVERNAQGAAAITENVKRDALVGQETVAATISGITEIRNSTQSTFSAIASLSSRVKAIGNIISVINELAEQTNLLALNSAIIAAQAGEHGKGFAVVADQIKGLATRTRNSTQEIDELISAIQKETEQAVTAIKITEQKVGEGERLSQKSGVALQKMVGGMEESLRQVSDIAEATVEQAKGSQQIRQSMELISNMVAQIAKSSREQGATSELIISAVERMKELTVNVRSSSHEQREIGTNIADSTGKMGHIISELERLRSEQSERSGEIRKAMQEMDKATSEDLSAVHIMEEGVENLSRQIGLLQSEMAKLKVN
ncbi:methyl-accepting chemotaxis protein TlpC [Geobacter sp. OR-1]|uniref:methyl-accepting chemotaxis protein n=1 Tax=Geobacter sp. OR-1 TaxID=1266765 RepID=UPI000542C4B6|nr:methyl-accepting chemotaxis protein [Geobacter sp. OR-1]GAM09246.1 methyl-accepting chemotaxis protein TlpC [Geobacter sp. OR-1]